MIDYLGISGVRGSVVCQDYSIAVRLSITGVGSGEAFPRGGVLSDSESLSSCVNLNLPFPPFHSFNFHLLTHLPTTIATIATIPSQTSTRLPYHAPRQTPKHPLPRGLLRDPRNFHRWPAPPQADRLRFGLYPLALLGRHTR